MRTYREREGGKVFIDALVQCSSHLTWTELGMPSVQSPIKCSLTADRNPELPKVLVLVTYLKASGDSNYGLGYSPKLKTCGSSGKPGYLQQPGEAEEGVLRRPWGVRLPVPLGLEDYL